MGGKDIFVTHSLERATSLGLRTKKYKKRRWGNYLD